MSRMVHEFSSPVERESGTAYTARVEYWATGLSPLTGTG